MQLILPIFNDNGILSLYKLLTHMNPRTISSIWSSQVKLISNLMTHMNPSTISSIWSFQVKQIVMPITLSSNWDAYVKQIVQNVQRNCWVWTWNIQKWHCQLHVLHLGTFNSSFGVSNASDVWEYQGVSSPGDTSGRMSAEELMQLAPPEINSEGWDGPIFAITTWCE